MKVRRLTNVSCFLIVSLFLAGCSGVSEPGNSTPAIAPSITAQPTNQTVAAGQPATFSVTAAGTAPLSYQWQKGTTAITGATSANYTTAATTTSDNGTQYRVVVSNSEGNATSNSATLTVMPQSPRHHRRPDLPQRHWTHRPEPDGNHAEHQQRYVGEVWQAGFLLRRRSGRRRAALRLERHVQQRHAQSAGRCYRARFGLCLRRGFRRNDLARLHVEIGRNNIGRSRLQPGNS